MNFINLLLSNLILIHASSYPAGLKYPIQNGNLTPFFPSRFMGIVFEEVRNLTLAVAARGINWKSMGLAGSTTMLTTVCGRLFNNLFQHADNITQSMIMRGFTTPEEHLFQLQQLRPTNPFLNAAAMALLLGLAGATYMVI